MKYVPKAITRTVGRSVLKTKTASPQLLFGAGLVGFAGTVFLACKATLKIEDILVDHEKNMLDVNRIAASNTSDKNVDYDRERRHITIHTSARIVKLYAPAVGVGALSVVCLTQSHKILTERNATLTAAYVGLQRFLDEYRGRVREKIGQEEEQNVFYASTPVELVQDTDNGPVKYFGTKPGQKSPYSQVFDDKNANWQEASDYNLHFLRIQEDRLTDKLRSSGSLSLNEVYDRLDLPRTPTGQICGWVLDSPESDDFVEIKIIPMHDFHGSLMLDFNAIGPITHMIRGRASGRPS